MIELVAMVVIGYLSLTLGIGALIGKGHGPATATADALRFDTQIGTARDARSGRDLGIGWDTTAWEPVSHDALAWDLAA
jgi:hypothetical protein